MNKLKNIVMASLVIGLTACASKKNVEISPSDDVVLERKEQKRQRPGGNRSERPEFSDLVAKMDANGDGLISISEAEGPLSEMFTKIDTNKDGNISAEEFSSMAPPQRGDR